MFPNEIKQILEKYQEYNKNELLDINSSIKNMSSQLKKVRSNLSHQLANIMDSDELSNNQEDELLSDLKVLKEYINSIAFISISTDNMEVSEELVPTNESQVQFPIFTRKVFPYLVTDDICPFDYAKLVDHCIYYQKIINNKLSEKSVLWHRCPVCNKLFVSDYELKDFDLEDTNIILNKEKYNPIPEIDIYTVIVLNNTLKCSANHDTEDIIAKLPVFLNLI